MKEVNISCPVLSDPFIEIACVDCPFNGMEELFYDCPDNEDHVTKLPEKGTFWVNFGKKE